VRPHASSAAAIARSAERESGHHGGVACWVLVAESAPAAAKFAAHAGVAEPTRPLEGLREELWQLERPEWREMEDCVHNRAARADADVHHAWRP
jgi:hypothetical protein